MAKIKPFTDQFGVHHPDCVWYPDDVHAVHSQRYAKIIFRGWHNLAALAAGFAPIIGAEKVYDVTGDDYAAIAPGLLTPISVAAYTHSASQLDTPDPTDTTFATEDPPRNQRHIAFFDACADVVI